MGVHVSGRLQEGFEPFETRFRIEFHDEPDARTRLEIRQLLPAHLAGPSNHGRPRERLAATKEVLGRAFEVCSEPITVARQPADRVVGVCRHFALLHTAFLRDQGVPARVRCGFANYFDRSITSFVDGVPVAVRL